MAFPPPPAQSGPGNAVRKPVQFIFNAKVYIPVQKLRRELSIVPFTVAHGPRFMDFELSVNIDPRQPSLVVECQSQLSMQIPGMFAMRFGASKDVNRASETDIPLAEMQQVKLENRFVMRGADPFLESLQRAVILSDYENGAIGLSIFIIYQAQEFMQFVERNSRIRPLTSVEHRNAVMIAESSKDFEVFGTTAQPVMHSKWMLYMGTKYFHRLIDENPTIKQAKLNYDCEVIICALCLALHNLFRRDLSTSIARMRETIELLCMLEPLNVDLAIERVAMELESAIFRRWEQLDLDEFVRILTLPKYWELEQLKGAARSVINDVYHRQFDQEYNEHSTGTRCALYQQLVSSGTLDEKSTPIQNELERIAEMRWRMSSVRKTIDYE